MLGPGRPMGFFTRSSGLSIFHIYPFTLACVLSRKERQAHSLIPGRRFSKPVVATYKSHIPQSGFYHSIKLVFSFLCHISQMVVNIKGEDRGLLTGSLKAKHRHKIGTQ